MNIEFYEASLKIYIMSALLQNTVCTADCVSTQNLFCTYTRPNLIQEIQSYILRDRKIHFSQKKMKVEASPRAAQQFDLCIANQKQGDYNQTSH